MASKLLYTGITNSIRRRVWQHKNDLISGFSSKYKCHRLVYFETFQDVNSAISREKQITGWSRRKKVALIEAANPTWEDLSESWYVEGGPVLRSE